MTDQSSPQALSSAGARKLANTTKTHVQQPAITPRWLTMLLQWKPLEAGVLRVNRVNSEHPVEVACAVANEIELPATFVDYDVKPREYTLSAISTVLKVNTRVADLFSSPYDQVREQLRLTIEAVKERQEDQLINNADYGLLNNAAPRMRIATRKGPP